MYENDILSRQVREAMNEARKTMGEVSDLLRERDKAYEQVAKVDTSTKEGWNEMLKMARFEVTHFLDKSEKFDQMLDKLGMDYDRFVEHELKELDAGTEEGRQQMLSMATVEMRDHGDSACFRDMLDKAGASYQEFRHYQETGEMYGNVKKQDASSPSFGSAAFDTRIKASELERDLKAGREIAAKNRIKELEEIRKKEEKRKEEEQRKKKAEQEAKRIRDEQLKKLKK